MQTDLDIHACFDPSMIALSDGRIRALNRAARSIFPLATSTFSLFDICADPAEMLRRYLVRCSGSRQPVMEKVSLTGPGGIVNYRCFGSAITTRRRGRPSTLLLRLSPVLDPRLSAQAQRMRNETGERRLAVALDQLGELRKDRLRLVEQYFFVTEALRVVEAQKRELQQEIKHIRTDERERIAQDLHDHVGHEMVAVLAGLRKLRDSAHGSARAHLDGITMHVAEVGRRIHRAVVGARPRIVEELGLSRALEVTLVSCATDGALDFSFTTKGAVPKFLPAPVESALYRVAQEAFTNVLKHARGARRIDVVLGGSATSVSLTITDNGAGYAPELQQRGELYDTGIGLLGMQQRMRSIGGVLQIESLPGQGTTVTALASLNREQRSAPS